MKSRLFKTAWAIRKMYATFSEALKQAWKMIKLQWALCLGVATFKYKKVDGSIREAKGTLDNVPATKGSGVKKFGLLTYFDLDAQDWRCAKVENILF